MRHTPRRLTLAYRRIVSFGLYTGSVAIYFYFFFPEIEIEEEHPESESPEDNDADADEDDEFEDVEPDEDSLFIPLSFAKRKERSFYRGSDPEWQEFVKLANDKEKRKKIQQDLVGLVMMHVNTNSRFSQSLGGSPKAGKTWLDIQFPNGPPPEFERTG